MSALLLFPQILQQALSMFRPEELFLSFNGGKDCTVLLDIIHNMNRKEAKRIKCIYVRPLNPFSEIEEFVEVCRSHYGITIATVSGGIKAALETICQEDPQLRACIMGSRKTDPYCERLEPFKVRPGATFHRGLRNWECIMLHVFFLILF